MYWCRHVPVLGSIGARILLTCRVRTHIREYERFSASESAAHIAADMGECCAHYLDFMAAGSDDGTKSKEVSMLDNVNKTQFGLGLLVVVAASLLLLDS